MAVATPSRSPSAPAWAAPAGGAAALVLLALALRLISGVGFANYDTLYGLVWGQQAAHGHTPTYDVPIAPTPHPLVEAVGPLTQLVLRRYRHPEVVPDPAACLGDSKPAHEHHYRVSFCAA